MKKVMMVLTGLMCLASIGCYTTVRPGYAGIKVNAAGSQRGVQDYPAQIGRVWYNPMNSDVIEYPTFMQTVSWTANKNEGHPSDESITFTTKESMAVNADISVSYAIAFEQVPHFYVKFRLDNVDEFTHGFLHNVVRDTFNEVAGRYSIDQIMGDNGPFLKEVKATVNAQVSQYGVSVDQLGFIGYPRPPENVINAINSKIQATQLAMQKQNEVAAATADANKAVAKAKGEADSQVTLANGDAEANRIRSASITPNILEMKRLENVHDSIWRWNGQMPAYMGSSSPIPFMQVPTPQR